jgi:hypothetical protein
MVGPTPVVLQHVSHHVSQGCSALCFAILPSRNPKTASESFDSQLFHSPHGMYVYLPLCLRSDAANQNAVMAVVVVRIMDSEGFWERH